MRERFSSIFLWSELDPERQRSILLIGGIGLILVLALAAVGYGFYLDRVAFKGQTVLQVGDEKFNFGQLDRRLKAELGPISGISSAQFGQVVGATLNLLEREELIRQAAEERGITATDQEVDAQMRDNLNLVSDASRDQLALALRRELQDTGLNLDEYIETARVEVLEAKMRQSLADAVDSEAEQADIRLLQVATEAEALEARSEIDAGTELAELAATLSIHSSQSSAGEVGWVPRGALPEPIEDVAFSIEVGEISEVIESTEGFFILEVRGREVRAVEEEARNQVVNRGFRLLLEEIRDRVGSEITLDSDQLGRLAESLQSSIVNRG